VFMRR